MDGIAAVTARVPSTTASGASTALATTSSTSTTSGSAFDAALSRATTSTAGSTAGSSASNRVDADGVPVDLKRYGNGKIPSDALTEVGVGRHKLWPPAAEGFQDLMAAAKQAGVTIGVTDSYRSYEAQVDVARRKGLYKDGGLAAVPGTSDHGWGLSVDLDLNSKAQAWMRDNADRFGFVEDVPREPWHWTFTP